jgi:hypothetical protein
MRTITLAAFLLLVALSVACGDDDDGGSDGTAGPTAGGSPVNSSDEEAIQATLEQYTSFINDENWEGMCSLYSQNVLSNVTCDQLAAGLQSTAPGYAPGSMDATIENIEVLEVVGDDAKVKYDFCIIVNGQDTCYTPTASMFREGGAWRVGFSL